MNEVGCFVDVLPIAMWNDRLKDKLFGYRTSTEAVFARQCYDRGLSVHKAQKAIEQMRLGKSN